MDLDAAAELAAQSAGPDATAEQRELRAGIARALNKVPEGQREVIMLRYILSLSVAETAAVVGRTEGAVKQLQLRGLATLRDILGREDVPPAVIVAWPFFLAAPVAASGPAGLQLMCIQGVHPRVLAQSRGRHGRKGDFGP